MSGAAHSACLTLAERCLASDTARAARRAADAIRAHGLTRSIRVLMWATGFTNRHMIASVLKSTDGTRVAFNLVAGGLVRVCIEIFDFLAERAFARPTWNSGVRDRSREPSRDTLFAGTRTLQCVRTRFARFARGRRCVVGFTARTFFARAAVRRQSFSGFTLGALEAPVLSRRRALSARTIGTFVCTVLRIELARRTQHAIRFRIGVH